MSKKDIRHRAIHTPHRESIRETPGPKNRGWFKNESERSLDMEVAQKWTTVKNLRSFEPSNIGPSTLANDNSL